ncbi:hypothetical protein [Taibaiella soli]|nr:hypothetical protein [Taibaiella soli]
MQVISKFRRWAPVVAIVAFACLASCTSTKKYGCPNHLNSGSVSIR